MTTTNVNKSWQSDCLVQQQAASILHGYAAWQKKQKAALSQFEKVGFPHRKMEQWKYTNLTSLVQNEFKLSSVPEKFTALKSENDFIAANFVDGVWQQLNANLAPGIIITSIKSMLDKEIDLDFPEQCQTMFTQLNLALMTDGLFVFIPKNVVLAKPIHLRYHNVQAGVMHHPRHIIVAEDNAEFSLVEEYVGDANYFNNVVVKISLGNNAKLNYTKLQRESTTAFHIANTLVELGSDAVFNSYHIGIGAKIARDDVNLSLAKQGASCALYGLYSPRGSQLIDYHTRINHQVGNTHSKQIYKGLVDDKARAVFNGKVVVEPNAQKITAHQNNANLLLSPNAEVNTKPELEIYADDVKCSHGATVGQLDEKSLFYLRSRGIPLDIARAMLTTAFAEEIFNEIQPAPVLHYVNQQLQGKVYV